MRQSPSRNRRGLKVEDPPEIERPGGSFGELMGLAVHRTKKRPLYFPGQLLFIWFVFESNLCSSMKMLHVPYPSNKIFNQIRVKLASCHPY